MLKRLKAIAMIIALLLCTSACTRQDTSFISVPKGYRLVSGNQPAYVFYNTDSMEMYFIEPLSSHYVLGKMYEANGTAKKYSTDNDKSETIIKRIDQNSYVDYAEQKGEDFCTRTKLYYQSTFYDVETKVMYTCIGGKDQTTVTPLYEPDGSLKLYDPNHEYKQLCVIDEDSASIDNDGVIYLYDPDNFVMYSYKCGENGEQVELYEMPQKYQPEEDEA